ncbi:MAG: hypothetical protein PHX16_05570 [Syntrophaceticus sp.]|nr:hypothetical protein [Syntrophaceticus sp.]MDD4783089.1 hypothetical protein [Syntrophaceticus sp.]
MGSIVLGVFDDRGQAEQAAIGLRDKGYHKDISVVARDEGKEDTQETRMGRGEEDNSPMAGITTGGTLGGLAGLAAGAGALVIPGIGPLLAVGPIAGLLSGAAAGGIAGGLIDWGIPEAEGRQYEEDIRQGKTLVSVQGSDERLNDAADLMRHHGAYDVKIF